jgi:hypothetical protein
MTMVFSTLASVTITCATVKRSIDHLSQNINVKVQGWGSVPFKCAITAVALQVGCSYLQTQGPTEQRPNGRKSHPSLATLELTAPKTYTGSRLPAQGMYTSAQHCLQFLRQQFSRESYGSKARSETTAETNCPAYFCLPLTAYSKGLESLASKNNLYQ